MKSEEYLQYDALGLAELVNNKSVKASELLDVAIEYAERYNPKYNALTLKMYDLAREYVRNNSTPVGVFAGVPFLLKDLGISYAGTPTSNGNKVFQKINATHDSEAVSRFKQAGLITFGKTNVPEFGISFTTESQCLGPCQNPWDPTRTPGGSSGGAAAAVSARIVPMASASDGGGSIRVPASCCGLFGLKPSRARTPVGPDAGEVWSGLSGPHVISISVRDSACALDVLQGPSIGDPYYAPPASSSFLQESQKPPRKLKIAFSHACGTPVAPECIEALQKAVKLCTELGHIVEEAAPTWNHAAMGEGFGVIVGGNMAMELELGAAVAGRALTEDDVEPMTWLFAQQGHQHSASNYAKALRLIHINARQIAQFYQEYDMMLTPTLAHPPVKIGTFDTLNQDLETYVGLQYAFGPFTAIPNLTGQPAMSVPLHWTAEQLPIGVQVIGRFGDEASLLQLAHQLEIAAPWRDKMPPLEADD